MVAAVTLVTSLLTGCGARCGNTTSALVAVTVNATDETCLFKDEKGSEKTMTDEQRAAAEAKRRAAYERKRQRAQDIKRDGENTIRILREIRDSCEVTPAESNRNAFQAFTEILTDTR